MGKEVVGLPLHSPSSVSVIASRDGHAQSRHEKKEKQMVSYGQDLEERTLQQVRNERQKLTCSVVFSPSGAIESIEKIDDMAALGLRTLVVSSFVVNDRVIRFKEPIHLQEQLDDDTGSMIYVEFPDLNLMVFAEFQDDMEEVVHEELANKWAWIVESDDEDLTEDALEIKRRFLSITEITEKS